MVTGPALPPTAFPTTMAQVVSALRTEPILVEETRGSGRTQEVRDRLTTLAHELPYPVHIALISQPRDFSASPTEGGDELVTVLHRRLGQPGLYVVDAGQAGYGVQVFGEPASSKNVDLVVGHNLSYIEDQVLPDVALAPGAIAEAAMLTVKDPIPADAWNVDYPITRDKVTLPDADLAQVIADGRAWEPAGAIDTDPGSRGIRPFIAFSVGAFLLLIVPWVLKRNWRRASQNATTPTAAAPGPDPTVVRAEADDELTALAEALEKLPSSTDAATYTSSAAALVDRDAAELALQTGTHGPGRLEDAVGALVLARHGRRQISIARGRSTTAYRPCFFNPLHGEATTSVTWGLGDGDATVPACRNCRSDVRAGRRPDCLPGHRGAPYFEGDDVWARTGYGSLADDLARQVLAGGAGR